MPTRPDQILALLQRKRSGFSRPDQGVLSILQAYRRAYRQLFSDPDPSLEIEDGTTDQGLRRFPERWPNREASLSWVRQQLAGVTTFACDGSQIYPSKDFSVPVALVQIGWFENPHNPDQPYRKDIELDLLTPEDFRDCEREFLDRQVNLRRFRMEIDRLCRWLEERAGQSQVLALFDGSLVATFAQAFEQEVQQAYIDELVRLLRTSEQTRVPLIGFVDTSYAHDLSELLQRRAILPASREVHDAQILAADMRWGDRTPLFPCQRQILSRYGDQAERLVYGYLKTHDGFPARLELPRWMLEDGIHRQAIDWLRAEVIVGGGYPYAIETADQTAVLKTEDRSLFYRVLQDWIDQQGLELRLSRKMVSKLRRR